MSPKSKNNLQPTNNRTPLEKRPLKEWFLLLIYMSV